MGMLTIRLALTFAVALLFGSFSTQAAEAPTTFPVSEFKFTRPATWEWVEVTSSMRKAQLKVPGKDDKSTGEVVFFYFGPGNGGGTQANVDRWFGQFAEPRDQTKAKTESVTIGKHKVTYASAEGTYNSGMPGGPKVALTNHALLGAIVESEQGSVFVRLTAPKELAASAAADFKKMVEGALTAK